MTDKTETIEVKKRAHQETIDYLEKKKIALTLQLQKNRREINYLANDQRTFKKGIFYLINLLRLQNNKDPYTWNKKKKKIIRKSKPKNKVLTGYSAVIDNKYAFTILEVTSLKKETALFMDFLEFVANKDPCYEIKPPTLEARKTRIILID